MKTSPPSFLTRPQMFYRSFIDHCRTVLNLPILYTFTLAFQNSIFPSEFADYVSLIYGSFFLCRLFFVFRAQT